MPYNRRELGLRFVSRIYGPRSLGCLLSSVFIGAVLLTKSDVSGWVWLAMIFNLLVWPTLAYQCARRAPDPFKTEMRSIAADGLYAGFWAGQMALNILPSALLLSMVTMNAMAAGGWRLVRASIALQTLALLLTLSLSGFKVSLPSSTLQTACGCRSYRSLCMARLTNDCRTLCRHPPSPMLFGSSSISQLSHESCIRFVRVWRSHLHDRCRSR
jgi:hypothetical protein